MNLLQCVKIAIGHHKAGRLDEAELACREALIHWPDSARAMALLGAVMHERGQHAPAIQWLQRALVQDPTHAGSRLALAEMLCRAGNPTEAITHVMKVIRQAPTAAAHQVLGNALHALGEHNAAISALHHALQLAPAGSADVHNSLGVVLQARYDNQQAESCYRRAVELDPAHKPAWTNLGMLLSKAGRTKEALSAYEQALSHGPGLAETFNAKGQLLQRIHRPDEAEDAYRAAISADSQSAEAQANLGRLRLEQGRVPEAVDCLRNALRLRPDDARAHDALLFARIFLTADDAAEVRAAEERRWAQRHANPFTPASPRFPNDKTPSRRLRVGYVSPYFREHCQSLFTLPLLRSHDRAAVEIFCYSDTRNQDTITTQLRSHVDVWRDVLRLSDEELAAQVRADQIDVLVDLTMHLAENRALVFARKPAPVQVCWLAYPGSTGMQAMDYRISDPHLDPPGINEALYVETTLRLPGAFWCYDPLDTESSVAPLPAERNRRVTFGCLNNFCKINTPVLELWARVLRATPDSRITILAAEGRHRANALGVLRENGVTPDRVTFVTHRPRTEFLHLFDEIDIALDTFPSNGHTTSLDGLWMGVPVVTLVGNTATGRAGLCQLTLLQLPELIARTPDEYVRVATELAGDLPRLLALRTSLRERLRQSPLTDAQRFARNMESAYRAMWLRYCESVDQPASDFDVRSIPHVKVINPNLPRQPLPRTPIPSVSCIMVTSRRPAFARAAINCFLKQTYPDRELLVLATADDRETIDLVNAFTNARVRLVLDPRPDASLGDRRNLAIEHAAGELICVWDDDDLYAPDRLRVQVAALIEHGAAACVLERLTLSWPAKRRLGISGRRAWEGSLLAAKSALPRYAPLARAEDTPVIEAILHQSRVVSVDMPRLYVYQFHGQNTSPDNQFEYFWETCTWRCPDNRYQETLRDLLQFPGEHDTPATVPLVSCMMVSRTGRFELARTAINCFRAQTYSNRELLIVTEQLDPALAQFIDQLQDNRLRVVETGTSSPTLGDLRNAAVDASRGQFVCQWDDDDLHAPERLDRQLAAIRNANADACLLQRWTIWWPNQQRLAVSTRRPWEGSLLALKSALTRYPSLRVGEDTPVVEQLLQLKQVILLDAPELYIYRVHGNNTFAAAHFEHHWNLATERYEGEACEKRLSDLANQIPDLHASLKIPS